MSCSPGMRTLGQAPRKGSLHGNLQRQLNVGIRVLEAALPPLRAGVGHDAELDVAGSEKPRRVLARFEVEVDSGKRALGVRQEKCIHLQ